MRGLNKAESDALRNIALGYGYTVTRGPTSKDGAEAGNPIELLLAIIGGEVATVLLGDEERAYAIGRLLGSGDEVLENIGRQIQKAVEREDGEANHD